MDGVDIGIENKIDMTNKPDYRNKIIIQSNNRANMTKSSNSGD